MKRITQLSLAIVSVLILGTFVAPAVQAVQGPYFKINGTAGDISETILSPEVAKEKFLLEASAIKLTCNGTTALGRIFNQLPLRGFYLGVIHFTKCSVEGNGSPCAVAGGGFLTVPVLGLLGYKGPGRSGPLLVLYKPDTGKVFVNVGFTGAGCNVPETSIEGNTIGEIFAGGSAVEVGKNEVEKTVGEVRFTKAAKTILVESPGGGTGTLKTTKGELKAFGISSTLSGITELDLAGGQTWGVFTS